MHDEIIMYVYAHKYRATSHGAVLFSLYLSWKIIRVSGNLRRHNAQDRSRKISSRLVDLIKDLVDYYEIMSDQRKCV